jgi:hypothetical protein
VSQIGVPKSWKSSKKKFKKKFKKSSKISSKISLKIIIKNYKLLKGRGGWRIVIPMPEAINFVDNKQVCSLN